MHYAMGKMCARCRIRVDQVLDCLGESGIYSPQRAFTLCEPCFLEEEQEIDDAGGNNLPSRIDGDPNEQFASIVSPWSPQARDAIAASSLRGQQMIAEAQAEIELTQKEIREQNMMKARARERATDLVERAGCA